MTHTHAAIRIQAMGRCYLAKLRRVYLKTVSKVVFVQHWIRKVLFNWQTKACRKIIRYVRSLGVSNVP